MWKACNELEALGRIGSKRPRMIAVQAEGCARAAVSPSRRRTQRLRRPWTMPRARMACFSSPEGGATLAAYREARAEGMIGFEDRAMLSIARPA
jgi:hypothetical protein